MAHEHGIGRGRVDMEGGHDSGEEVDRPKARGNRRGEGKQDDHKNTLPLVGRVSGQVRLYEERERRGTGTTRIERELERSSKQARYPGDDWRQDERLTTIAGGAVSRGHHKNREGNRAFWRPACYPGEAWRRDKTKRLKTIVGGVVS